MAEIKAGTYIGFSGTGVKPSRLVLMRSFAMRLFLLRVPSLGPSKGEPMSGGGFGDLGGAGALPGLEVAQPMVCGVLSW